MPRRRVTRAALLFIGGAISASTAAPVALAQPAPAHSAAIAARGDSLTTAQFAALVNRLSDSGGYFDTDNLISNESSYLHPLTTLQRLGVRGGAYIGVGPDQNFSIIAELRPTIAFITDIRRDNLLQHLLFKALFDLSPNRATYIANWLGRPQPPVTMPTASIDDLVSWATRTSATTASAQAAIAAVRQRVVRYGVTLSATDLATIERFHRAFIAEGPGLRFTSTGRAPRDYYPTLGELMRERDLNGKQASYLADERSFQTVKSLERRNLIVPVVGDLSGPNTLPRIGRVLAERNEKLSVLYASNVEDYLIRDGRFPAYLNALSQLPRASASVVIRSWFGGPMSHPSSVPGYYTTQIVQPLGNFVTDSSTRSVRRYGELVLKR